MNQTLNDCLNEAMDLEGLIELLTALERGDKQLLPRDLPHPSPLALEILNARPYGFLDDAPLEERRTQAVMSRRWLDPAEAEEFGKLDAEAIARVREQAWPDVENADELHDALMLLGALPAQPLWKGHFEALVAARRATLLSLSENLQLWVAAERLPMLRAIYSEVSATPPLEAPAEFTTRAWSPEEALIELVRGQLQALGPVTVTQLAQQLGVALSALDQALVALEGEGFALRGRFTPDTTETEWCERRLLARIHRYTIERLRAEIEPLPAADFLRFLFRWQGLTTDPRPEGPQALAAIVEQLEGFEAAATAWEADILPARLQHYDPEWLDSLCLSGRVLWARLTPPKPAAGKDKVAAPVRTTPIALVTRPHSAPWQRLVAARQSDELRLSPRAQSVADYLRAHGASFFDDILASSGLMKSQTEEALAELVGAGLLHADSFAGLRALLVPSDKRRAVRGSRHRRLHTYGIAEAGRWTLTPRPAQAAAPAPDPETVEQIARLLLRRYGVVYKRMLEREANWLPPWYELLRVYRRLEARGEIRGGRFVAGFSGEQYALPEAVAGLRALRKEQADGQLVSVSAADPLNLVGILTPGARIAAHAGNRVLYRDGVPIAVQTGGETHFLTTLEAGSEWQARNALLRQPLSPSLRSYLH